MGRSLVPRRACVADVKDQPGVHMWPAAVVCCARPACWLHSATTRRIGGNLYRPVREQASPETGRATSAYDLPGRDAAVHVGLLTRHVTGASAMNIHELRSQGRLDPRQAAYRGVGAPVAEVFAAGFAHTATGRPIGSGSPVDEALDLRTSGDPLMFVDITGTHT